MQDLNCLAKYIEDDRKKNSTEKDTDSNLKRVYNGRRTTGEQGMKPNEFRKAIRPKKKQTVELCQTASPSLFRPQVKEPKTPAGSAVQSNTLLSSRLIFSDRVSQLQ